MRRSWLASWVVVLVALSACQTGKRGRRPERRSVCDRPVLAWSAPFQGKVGYYGLALRPAGREDGLMPAVPNLVRSWERACGRAESRSVLLLEVQHGRILRAEAVHGGRRARCIASKAVGAELSARGVPEDYSACVFLNLPRVPGRASGPAPR